MSNLIIPNPTKKLCRRLSVVKSGKDNLFSDGYCIVEDKTSKNRVMVGFDEDRDDRVFSLLNKVLEQRLFRLLVYVGESKGTVLFVLRHFYWTPIDTRDNVCSLLENLCDDTEGDSWGPFFEGEQFHYIDFQSYLK